MSTPDNQSYLAAGINKLSPWGPRSPLVKAQDASDQSSGDIGLKQQRGGDHKVSHRHRLSLKRYPRDCPPLRVQWFFAVDVPKRKPVYSDKPLGKPEGVEAPKIAPKKYAPFSQKDSRAIETAFHKVSGEDDAAERRELEKSDDITNEKELGLGPHHKSAKVPVNEDYLFDVDVLNRELAPAYWLGPVYEVRRGTWFYQEGAVQKPCDENLAAQLEEQYLRATPWRWKKQEPTRSASQSRSATSSPLASKGSLPNLRDQNTKHADDAQSTHPVQTYRLFGPHSNSVVTYQDTTTAWILTEDFISRMSSGVYKRFAGGAHYAGTKVTRGYTVQVKKPEEKEVKADSDTKSATVDVSSQESAKSTALVPVDGTKADSLHAEIASPESEKHRQTLEQQMSSLVSAGQEDPQKQDEEIRKRDEKEIQDDYRDREGEQQDREIEHLLLVTHGIGQRLGLRMESVNFVGDVNTLRKTLKAVYGESADLQALNSEVDALPKNCRIQVLPINWRHKLDFPNRALKHNRKEHDLAFGGFGEEEDYPNLDNISVEGVPAVRNLITDLALDILLYQSPAYKDAIATIVLEECNRIHKLFCERNPSFNGKVSLVGHSLGSAIMFDILCLQEKSEAQQKVSGKASRNPMKLNFDVEDFYALGSPIGLFQMLKGRTIAARDVGHGHQKNADSSSALFGSTSSSSDNLTGMGTQNSDLPISSPKCRQVFNIFHPTDPISYRIEPLISPAMSSLKPQPLPYTKRGIFSTATGQGLTGIGARVGQSVSGLWSSFSSGIASSLLNRSLGFTAEDAGKLGGPAGNSQSRTPLSLGGGTNAAGGLVPVAPATNTKIDKVDVDTKDRLVSDAQKADEAGERPPTLIDAELETLYAGFQNTRKGAQGDVDHEMAESERAEAEQRGRKLKKEEAKVRALNSNGRVDYSIQE
ncbi:hypothetical protein AUEXF2481DRAFT_190257 [Aureobasidium subglaciale EXF-2481]|uniref:DDHD domain-containing protein n=1 Tax=Aureobasidium subglaciale (strain EXF-2481) TaxID=1043005 RepID=A0A074YPH1_AURSE|nr:uncharacterized protein AUEXF2481DRAFT_190257 [Aureobasidium subglaciale EXF-2481]KAI5204593.1 hypothetical protein E4T38_04664 [Aureobasidium subglaciale]KAI5223743.1 hypothetical protein E4T40_04440 [Aureobasidium subglaciale]KAI5227182.1 hypothetical protein E4T41_04433 [Aureobasidium subglaciale]KAI5262612.1 hypothetical protein E4T46_04319 [Aureobasidium subglaciale]KEQ99673.1 hypothetical protein AUEXF2481DRAFT_190257 [Aureobasidium subglaciale EXF-2481]